MDPTLRERKITHELRRTVAITPSSHTTDVPGGIILFLPRSWPAHVVYCAYISRHVSHPVNPDEERGRRQVLVLDNASRSSVLLPASLIELHLTASYAEPSFLI